METTGKQIESFIKRRPRGTLFFPDDFGRYGSSDAVRKALERLTDKGHIVRVAHGIYVRPEESKYIGVVMPPVEAIAEAIAKRDKIRTIPTGAYALNALGLSTQIPMKIVMLTDGSPREIKIGRRTITFKKSTPANLMAKGKISRLVIQALKEIGHGKVNEDDEHKILDLLRKEDRKDLEHDISLAPVWIQKIMKKAL